MTTTPRPLPTLRRAAQLGLGFGLVVVGLVPVVVSLFFGTDNAVTVAGVFGLSGLFSIIWLLSNK